MVVLLRLFLLLTVIFFVSVLSLPFSSLSSQRFIRAIHTKSSRFLSTTTYCDEREPGIYVLGLKNDKYYVGKSMLNVTARVQEHFLTGGSAWTKTHQPIEQLTPILNASDDLESSERAETLERMWSHGIESTRGWKYTKIVLYEFDYESIFREMCERKDLCRKCGRQNHMASSCNYRDLASWVEPGRLPNRERILQGGDTRRTKAEDKIASMAISNGNDKQQQQQQQFRGGKVNSPNMTKQKPTTPAVSAKTFAVESTTTGTITVTTNEGNTKVDNVRPSDNVRPTDIVRPKEQTPRRKDTGSNINTATTTTPQTKKSWSSSSSLPPQSKVTGVRVTGGNVPVDVTAKSNNGPATVTAVALASSGVVATTAGSSVSSTKSNSNKKRNNNDVNGNTSNKTAKNNKALWSAATQSFLFNAALSCLYRSSATRWASFSLYHVLITPILEPQTLLWMQWLDTKVGQGQTKPILQGLFTLFSSVFLLSCWRLVALREVKTIQVITMILARSAGQAMLWLPWLTTNEVAAVDTNVADLTAMNTTSTTITTKSNLNNTTRRKQKPSEGRRGTIAASSLTGLLGLIVGWFVGGGNGRYIYSF